FYTSEAQKEEAEQFVKELNESSTEGERIVTQIEPLQEFYPAEEYHKDYYARNTTQGYCQVVINPKLEKVQKEFAELLEENNQ
ncbi:MAG: peptide-methionine (S)-S-oxide reductase, partial [Candidatus Spechtbacterales bacterium]